MSIEEEPEKKQKGTFKIMGFNIPKKPFIIVITIVILLIIGNVIKTKNDDAKWAAEQAALRQANQTYNPDKPEQVDREEARQADLRKQFGIPPEGFKWSSTGKLIALGDDDSKNAEDIVYTFIRALSMLDFATAQKYSTNSKVYNTYTSFYRDTQADITNYYNEFLRKQYKLALTTVEVKGVSDVAVFADGTEYITLTVSALDLQDKDFWQNDKEALFQQMRIYAESETDSIKKEQYVYNYIYDSYVSGKIGKRDYTIEIVLKKENNAGWLVTDDNALDNVLDYTKGVNVANYILNGYEKWYRDTLLREQREQREQSKGN